jgi:nitrous oxidase accessory protein NosD
MRNPKITSRITAIRTPSLVVAALTLEGHLSELNRLKNIALDANKPEAAIRAEELRGKAAGLYITKVETGAVGEFAALGAMRKQDAISAIQSELDRRARLTNGAAGVQDVEVKV